MFNPVQLWYDKQMQVVLFASTAIALYGYDQGMMSLVNTNKSYLSTMGISEDDTLVGVIVSVYYLGCAVGAVAGSSAADYFGRKTSIFGALFLASLGNLLMFVSGLGDSFPKGSPALGCMFLGRVVMGLGIGGIDAVVPVYSSELSEDDGRGKSLAQEFQANILGLNMAFAVNLIVTNILGKENQWAWRLPIILMQIFPLSLMAIIGRLPESPRFHIMHDQKDEASAAIKRIFDDDEEVKKRVKELVEAHEQESSASVSYIDMIFKPSSEQFHPTMLTIMAQVNQALTGYGAVSVYGPQIFELLGFGVMEAEYITQGNYVSYLFLMTFAWLLIDAVGRRSLMVWGSLVLITCFMLLTVFGGLAQNSDDIGLPSARVVGIPGAVILFIATGAFGIGWLAQVFLIPTEMFPTSARARGTAVSVIIWGLANFFITLVTPILFNNLKYYLFLVFAATNAFAGWFTWIYQPETGGRSFEENQRFFTESKEMGDWRVAHVSNGEFQFFPGADKRAKGGDSEASGEQQPLLHRIREQT